MRGKGNLVSWCIEGRMKLQGRRKIYTDTQVINSGNVIKELQKALNTHLINQQEEDYLWDYYKGEVPVLYKTKVYRKEINNVVHENRAMQIVEFYEGYIFGEPIKYVRRGNDETLNDEIEWLNGKMDSIGKIALDDELAEYMLVMGVCPRIVLPSDDHVFDMFTLDPRFAFNVYANVLGEKVVMSVLITQLENGTYRYTIYTDHEYFVIENNRIINRERHILGKCPMVEYTLNNVRMGIFEPVISLLDAIDLCQSNRLDDVQQFVNSILTILGGEIDEDTISKLKDWGALSLPEGVDAKYLTSVLSQGDIETLKEDLIDAVIDITGMPDRDSGASGGDTGSAILLRSGWEIADAKSKRIEIQFKKSEHQLLELVYKIAEILNIKNISNDFVEIRFTRRNYENIQVKAQVLTTMLDNGKIAPELAFTHCGMFSDPLLAYEVSKPYIDKNDVQKEVEVTDVNGDQVSNMQQTAR